jgi:hypothetical protein
MFKTANGTEYPREDIEMFVYDSVVEGNCSHCDCSYPVEPDAEGYPCDDPSCEGKVNSVLIELFMI